MKKYMWDGVLGFLDKPLFYASQPNKRGNQKKNLQTLLQITYNTSLKIYFYFQPV